jgi:hypothetical protein
LKIDGTAWCTGFGGTGGIGNGAFNNVSVFTAVTGGHIFTELSAGNHFACAIREGDAKLLCWGGSPQSGSDVHISVPTVVESDEDWLHVDAAEQATCAITDASGLGACWGDNVYGTVGIGWDAVKLTPFSIGCSAPNGKPGELVYNSDHNIMQYCNGVTWTGIDD